MKRLFAVLVAAFVVQAPLAAVAAPVNVGTWYEFAFGGPGSPLVDGTGTTATINPVAAVAPDAPWTFTLATAGTLTVLDLFESVDQFDILDFAVVLGPTSAPVAGGTCFNDIGCALADARYSRGVFNLAAGNHSISGSQILGIPGAGVFIVEADRVVIPVPASLLLLVSALGLMGGAARLRRRA